MPRKQLLQARIDKTVKEDAAAVLADVGLTVSGALRRASFRSLAAGALIAPLGVCSPAGDHGTAPATVRDSLGVVIVESTGHDRPLDETPVRVGVLTHPDRTLDFVPWGIADALYNLGEASAVATPTDSGKRRASRRPFADKRHPGPRDRARVLEPSIE
ncbi:MAG: type II toxin-antitoxin system RelB/DinJ family antitoxin [Gemmatimonadetes bacterium]|nr:type II toxin-antitoxin system RelB/DinJ family antitoxin [Gemmatimonadota bacterium]MCY3944392.1 type II toxin-antitoxin system RelB/DinJ family antitoxin [Gemmatimonadota bacterium]